MPNFAGQNPSFARKCNPSYHHHHEIIRKSGLRLQASILISSGHQQTGNFYHGTAFSSPSNKQEQRVGKDGGGLAMLCWLLTV
jgi:hypothetical protein